MVARSIPPCIVVPPSRGAPYPIHGGHPRVGGEERTGNDKANAGVLTVTEVLTGTLLSAGVVISPLRRQKAPPPVEMTVLGWVRRRTGNSKCKSECGGLDGYRAINWFATIGGSAGFSAAAAKGAAFGRDDGSWVGGRNELWPGVGGNRFAPLGAQVLPGWILGHDQTDFLDT